MQFNEYSHRHGKEIMPLTHKTELDEISSVLSDLPKFPHGREKNRTVKEYIASAFVKLGWNIEVEVPLGTGKADYCDLVKKGLH